MKIVGVYVIFSGREHAATSPSSSVTALDGQSFNRSRRTLTLFEQVKTVDGCEFGTEKSLAHSYEIEVKDNCWDFSFVVPDWAPPTVEVSSKGYVKYKIELVVVWNSLIGQGEMRVEKDIRIGRWIHRISSEDMRSGEMVKNIGLDKLLNNETGPFRARIVLLRDVTYPQDHLKFNIQIDNPTNRVLKKLDVRVVSHLEYGSSSSDKDVVKYSIQEGFPVGSQESLDRDFAVCLPDETVLLPSFRGTLLSVSYVLIFEFPGMSFGSVWKLMLPLNVSSVSINHTVDDISLFHLLNEEEDSYEYEIIHTNTPDNQSYDIMPEYVYTYQEQNYTTIQTDTEDILTNTLLNTKDTLTKNLQKLIDEPSQSTLQSLCQIYNIPYSKEHELTIIQELAEHLLTEH